MPLLINNPMKKLSKRYVIKQYEAHGIQNGNLRVQKVRNRKDRY